MVAQAPRSDYVAPRSRSQAATLGRGRESGKARAHQLARSGGKGGPYAPFNERRIYQPQVGIMYEGGGLAAGARAGDAQAPPSDALQFRMEEWSGWGGAAES